MHPRMVDFFNASLDRLASNYTESQGASDATKGGIREHGVRDALRHALPPMARIEAGDIIDAYGRQTGQIDGAVIDDRSPTLKSAEDKPGVILAEGVIAVLESKSSVSGQWEQVRETFSKTRPIERSTSGLSFAGRFEASLPFFVIGLEGWRKPETLAQHVRELHEMAPRERPASVFVLTLDPLIVSQCGFDVDPITYEIPVPLRGHGLATMWTHLTRMARSVGHREIDFLHYLTGKQRGGEPPPSMPTIELPELPKIEPP